MTTARGVSLVMTVLDEEAGLPAFLKTLAVQTVSPTELVVVDGGSSDRTPDLLAEWADVATYPVKIIVEPGANISEGRNRAIAAASHDLIAVTDAGTLLDPRWLAGLLKAAEPSVEVVAGFFEPCWTTKTERLIAAVTVPLVEEVDGDTFLPSSRSLLMSRRAWQAAGGYPEWLDYCEDLVLDLAMKRAGMTFAFAPHAVARWSARPTWRSYVKQYYRYARGDGKADLWRKRHAMRYGAYVTGAVGMVAGPWWVRLFLAAGFAGYTRHYFRRAWRRRPPGGGGVRMLAQVPAVVVVGDLAKMAGYPVGLLWRARSPEGSSAREAR